ncbi:unnamed protein product, partial [Ectocarpus sp. 13 AM-2016]
PSATRWSLESHRGLAPPSPWGLVVSIVVRRHSSPRLGRLLQYFGRP